MIAFAIILDKLCCVCTRVYTCKLFADEIIIKFLQNTSALLIERSVMFRVEIPTAFTSRFNYFPEFCKDVNFIIIVENLFGRAREQI